MERDRVGIDLRPAGRDFNGDGFGDAGLEAGGAVADQLDVQARFAGAERPEDRGLEVGTLNGGALVGASGGGAPGVGVNADGKAGALINDGRAGVAAGGVGAVANGRTREAGIGAGVGLLSEVPLVGNGRARAAVAGDPDVAVGTGGCGCRECVGIALRGEGREARVRVIEDTEGGPVIADAKAAVALNGAGIDRVLILRAGVLSGAARSGQRHVELDDLVVARAAVASGDEAVGSAIEEPSGASDGPDSTGAGVVRELAVVGGAADRGIEAVVFEDGLCDDKA